MLGSRKQRFVTIPLALAVSCGLSMAAVGAPASGVAGARTCAGEKATIVGNSKNNRIEGTPRRDVIVAGDGNDVINAMGGNDLICAGEGADTIYPGPDDDVVYAELDQLRTDKFGRVTKIGDTIHTSAGNDTIDTGYDARPATPGARVVPDTMNYASAPAPAVVDLRAVPTTIGADGTDTVTVPPGSPIGFVGTAFDDAVRGTYKDDRLYGRGGSDQLYGQAGDDVITTDGGDGPLGHDLVDAGSGSDRVTSIGGMDSIAGGGGHDTIVSTSTTKMGISGGSGSDTVVIPVPAEDGFKVVGGSGQDKFRMTAYPNPVVEPKVRIDQRKGVTSVSRLLPVTIKGKIQSFSEVALAPSTRTIYKGTDKSEVIDASPDAKATIKGRGGADVITGSDKKDLLVGGRGFDIGNGKGGKDRCKLIERRKSC